MDESTISSIQNAFNASDDPMVLATSYMMYKIDKFILIICISIHSHLNDGSN